MSRQGLAGERRLADAKIRVQRPLRPSLRHHYPTSGCFGWRLSPSQRVSYAAQRINSARNGMTSKFGWLQASATRNCSAALSSECPATIRIDKNEGRITCLSGRKSRVRVASPMVSGRSQRSKPSRCLCRDAAAHFRFIEAHAQEARRLLSIRGVRFPRFFECAASEFLACRLALTSVCAELDLPSVALGYFGASAIVRVKSLPTGGKPGRRNWRPRTLRDMPFRSTPETSEAGRDAPIHDVTLPPNAEMICPVLSVAAAMFECSCVALLRDRLSLDAAPQVAASECLLLVH